MRCQLPVASSTLKQLLSQTVDEHFKTLFFWGAIALPFLFAGVLLVSQ